MIKQKAFTLIELMLTVMVIAILVSIAIPNYINTVERARAREARATLESIRAAEQSYAAERRKFITLTDTTDWQAIGLEDPNASTGSSWTYTGTASGVGNTDFDATATRINGPYQGYSINLDQDGVETTPLGENFY